MVVLLHRSGFDAAFNQAWLEESSVAESQSQTTERKAHLTAFNIAW
jgi:hypothetical protein